MSATQIIEAVRHYEPRFTMDAELLDAAVAAGRAKVGTGPKISDAQMDVLLEWEIDLIIADEEPRRGPGRPRNQSADVIYNLAFQLWRATTGAPWGLEGWEATTGPHFDTTKQPAEATNAASAFLIAFAAEIDALSVTGTHLFSKHERFRRTLGSWG